MRVFQFLIRWASSRTTRSGVHPGDSLEIVCYGVIRDDLEKGALAVLFFADLKRAFDDPDTLVRKLDNLRAPLVLERGRADDEDALDAGLALEDEGGAYRLYRLAEAHFVGEESPVRRERRIGCRYADTDRAGS